jgi:spore coat protein CotH
LLGTKFAERFAVVFIAAAFLISIGLCMFSGTAFAGADSGVAMEYESALFDHRQIISVNIIMDEDEWQDMLDNAASEEYYKCDAVINGTTFYSVGIRPKGNTSLSSIVNDPTTDRYSFKLEFDKYVDGQTCFGLDKLVLNNNYADSTNMKEAIVYDMFDYLGADSSLYNYAKISVNGEYCGVYLALEAVEDSFLLRNYGVSSGGLYKPDSMKMGGGKGGNDDKSGNGGPGGNGGRGGAMNFGSSGGCDLNYTDDDLDSYSDIWDAEVTSTSKSDHKRVAAALKAAAEGTDLEKYLDIDNLLRYMAAHTFSVNLDSLSGNMAHNYYLYENNGVINLIPWDYNLAFGGMNSNDSDAMNFAIDSPFSGTQFFDKILENEEYLAKYHEYLCILSEEYVQGGVFQQTYDRIRSQIDDLVSTDPNAFFTYDEYDAASQMLVKVVGLRAESVLGQLDGTVPSTTEAQRQNSAALIDTSDIDISVMGTMGGNKGGMGDKREFNAQAQQTATESSGTSTDNAESADTASSADSDATGISAKLVSLSDTTLVPDGQPPELPANGNTNGAGGQAGQDSQGSQNGQGFGGNGTPPEKPSGDPPSVAPGGEITQPAQPERSAQPSESGDSSSTSGADHTASGTAGTPASDSNKTPEPAGTTGAAATGKTAEGAEDASSDDNSTANGQPGFPGGNANNANNTDNAGNAGNGNGGFGGGFPGNPGRSGSSGTSGSSNFGLVPLLISAGAAAAGLLFAALFRRR